MLRPSPNHGTQRLPNDDDDDDDCPFFDVIFRSSMRPPSALLLCLCVSSILLLCLFNADVAHIFYIRLYYRHSIKQILRIS